jgi:hypothetical protein
VRWSWHGAVALVLALAVGAGYAVALIVAVLHPEDLSGVATAMLYTLGGALVGGVVTWLGGVRRGGDDDE